jgi:carbonic anhydrase
MERLIEGYHRFRAETWPHKHKRYEKLSASGQQPETLIIACSDSRVDPSTVFDAGPGELFVVRNIAGLVPPYRQDGQAHGYSAALEYGVRVLKVKRIVVMGHAQCGGVRAMVEGAPTEAKEFVEPWMAIAKDSLGPMPAPPITDAILHHYEGEVVRLSVANLLTFPWIAEAVEAGSLKLEGFSFAVATGVLSRLVGDRFEPVV